MIETELRNNESKAIDVTTLYEFRNKFVSYQKNIEKAVVVYLDFWKELREDNPNILKLHNLGWKITNQTEQVHKEFKELYKINSNNVKMLFLYGNFLKDVANDDSESYRILEKYY